MYRHETLITGGKDKIVLLLNNGMGIENFKIFFQNKDCVEVGFTMKTVRTTGIKTFYKNTYIEKMMLQNYYVLDLKTRKLLRVHPVKNMARMDDSFNKAVVMFGIWSDVSFEIDADSEGFQINAYDSEGKAYYDLATRPFVEENDMPGKITVVDFKDLSVDDVDQIIFLDLR